MNVESIPGLTLINHEIEVPLDHADPSGATLTLFAREVRRPGDRADREALVYLQGGPGGESPRPTGTPGAPGWLARALEDYRVILLDQRGTGRSTPLTAMSDLGPDEQRDRLVHYRADSIVADAELLREHLGLERWSLLGQSFGGFCSLHYLSRHPDRLREVYFTGGLPPVGMPVDEIYAATYGRTLELVERHYARFPGDRLRMGELVRRCDEGRIRLPHGGLLSAEQLRGVGHALGMTGGSEQLHYLLERDPDGVGFGHEVAAYLPFSGHSPLYALVHESSYADGGATRWASERVRPAAYDEDPTLLTAEHVLPRHLREDPLLAPFAETADLLAEHPWPRLYDVAALARADVPCAAIIYHDDPYVLREHGLATAGLLPDMRPWITNEWLHNGLRVAGDVVLDRLIGLARGRV